MKIYNPNFKHIRIGVRKQFGDPPAPWWVIFLGLKNKNKKCLESPEMARKLIRICFCPHTVGHFSAGQACSDLGARTPIGASGNGMINLIYQSEDKYLWSTKIGS